MKSNEFYLIKIFNEKNVLSLSEFQLDRNIIILS